VTKRIGCWIAVAAVLCGVGARATDRLVAINEVAWAGAEWNAAAEWIELVNLTEDAVDLEGWRLVSSDGAPNIVLSGTLSAPRRDDPNAGYFLLGRSDADLPGISPDIVYMGALNDHGEILYLYDAAGALVDTANRPPTGDAAPRWPAGTDRFGRPPCCTMERIDPRAPDQPSNWTDGCPPSDTPDDEPGVPGTPKRENRAFNLAPRLDFTVTPRTPRPGEPARFDASASVDPNDEIVSFSWAFGDGEAGSGQTPSHIYAGPGVYMVTLTARDTKGGLAQMSQGITVAVSTPPVADFSVVPLGGRRTLRTGDRLEFRDESTDADGPIVNRHWDFGDGTTGAGERAVHSYERAGQFVVILAVRDAQGDTDEQTQSVAILNRPPTARFEWTPAIPRVSAPVRFDASSASDPDGSIVEYRWDFDGDGTFDLITDDPITERTFGRPGQVTVALVVVDDDGGASLSAVKELRVNAPPVAQFQVSDFRPIEREPVRFTDCSHDPDGSIVAWEWTFGDGSSATEPSPQVAYNAAGTYTVRLIVTDDDGATASAAAEVRVENLPPVGRLSVRPAEQPTGAPFAFDATASHDPSPEGSIVRYQWDVTGDGDFEYETTEPLIAHTYDEPGEYRVTLRVIDDHGAWAVAAVTVAVRNRPPVVRSLTWEPSAPNDGALVRFEVDAWDPDGHIVSWEWTFADGSRSTAERPEHRFSDDGTHEVRVVVHDDHGEASAPFTVDVPIANTPPIARFGASTPTPCDGGYAVRFDASGSYDPSPAGRIVHVAWQFGDGASCPGAAGACAPERLSPVHCYRASGTYLVTLIVIDDDGALGLEQRTIRVP